MTAPDSPDNHPDEGPCDGFHAGRCWACALRRGELRNPHPPRTYAQLEAELGTLYTLAFADGGHRYHALSAAPDVVSDDPLFGTGPQSARLAAFTDELWRRTHRAEAAERALAHEQRYRHLLVRAILRAAAGKPLPGLAN